MDIVYQKERVSCADVQSDLIEPPSYSAVRAMLNKLVDKEYLEIEAEGKKYFYSPVVPLENVSRGAVRRLVRTFFGGSVSGAIVALLDDDGESLDSKQIKEIEALLKKKRRESETNGE